MITHAIRYFRTTQRVKSTNEIAHTLKVDLDCNVDDGTHCILLHCACHPVCRPFQTNLKS